MDIVNKINLYFTHAGYQEPIINMTPHDVVIMTNENRILHQIPSSGTIRLTRKNDNKSIECGIINSTDRSVRQYHWKMYAPFNNLDIDYNGNNLEKAALIVSMPVADFIVQNNMYPDAAILIPDTGPTSVVRDEKGLILGVRNMIIYRIPKK